MSSQSCYRLEPLLDSPGVDHAFSSESFASWLAQLSGRGAVGILVSLVLKLEQLARVQLEVHHRLSLMLRLMPVVQDLADEIPKRQTGRQPSGASALSLEQRLWCDMYRALGRTLGDLDTTGGLGVRDCEWARLWLLGALLHCLGRQLELNVAWGWPLPPETWQRGHDLYAYYAGRAAETPRLLDLTASGAPGLDVPTAYKRLLVLGLLGRDGLKSIHADPTREVIPDPLADWARGSRLIDPRVYFGVLGTYLVETSRDEPPRLVPGALGVVERGWVVRVPRDLRALLGG